MDQQNGVKVEKNNNNNNDKVSGKCMIERVIKNVCRNLINYVTINFRLN